MGMRQQKDASSASPPARHAETHHPDAYHACLVFTYKITSVFRLVPPGTTPTPQIYPAYLAFLHVSPVSPHPPASAAHSTIYTTPLVWRRAHWGIIKA